MLIWIIYHYFGILILIINNCLQKYIFLSQLPELSNSHLK